MAPIPEKQLFSRLLEQTKQLAKQLGMTVRLEGEGILYRTSKRIDALLSLEVGKVEFPFVVEIKPRLSLAQIPSLVRLKEDVQNLIVYTAESSPSLLRKLKDNRIGYVTPGGEYFIPLVLESMHEPLKLPPEQKKTKASKFFSSKMMRVAFCLLADPLTLSRSQREIAEFAGVSLGSINLTLQYLEKQGFINRTNDGLSIVRFRELTERWALEFYNSLLPKLTRRRFRSMDRDILQTIRNHPPKVKGGYWGGDVGAQLLELDLLPAQFILYCDPRDESDIFKKLRLVPDEKGEWELREKFWNFAWPQDELGVVPELLVYSDLVHSGDARAEKAADQLLRKMTNEVR